MSIKLKGQQLTLTQLICLCLYYGLARYLPKSNQCGHIGRHVRGLLCRHIFSKCGKHVNIERGAYFGLGTKIEIGDYSGIGVHANVPEDIIIGNHVMMAPNCIVFSRNHRYDELDKPIMFQGETPRQQTVIGDDVWIGQNVIITPGRHVARGSVIAAGSVVTKDFPEYSVIGGNPAAVIKYRKQ